MDNKFWTSEKILSFAAISISLLTLFVFLYQTNLIRKQQYMSVLPYLEMGNYGTNSNAYKYVLKNNGVGPAILKSVKVGIKNGKIYNDVVDYVRVNLTKKDTIQYYYSNLNLGKLIPEKETIDVIVVNDNKIKSSQRLYQIFNKDSLLIQIEYESIYGEKWVIENGTKFPKKL